MIPKLPLILSVVLLAGCSRPMTSTDREAERSVQSAPSAGDSSTTATARAQAPSPGASPPMTTPPSATAAQQTRDTGATTTSRYSTDRQGRTGSPPD